MSLAALADTPPPRNAYFERGCAFGQWLDTLPPSERVVIDGWLPKDSGWKHSDITLRIREDEDYPGIDFADSMVSRHRREVCHCAR